MDFSTRHIYRLIVNGCLVACHRNKRRLEIGLVDVGAWIQAHSREVNPLKQLKSLHEQSQQVLQRIGVLETHFNAFRTSTPRRVGSTQGGDPA